MLDKQAIVPASTILSLFGCLLIIFAAVFAYHNSFSGPFVFDDIQAIVENPSIRNVWNIGRVLSPPLTSAGAVGRPVVNLTLSVNHALGGLNVVGYHIVNLMLHCIVALALYNVILLTLRLQSLRKQFENNARSVALAITLLWTVHPLLTNSITAVIHRSELIVGFFYLFWQKVRKLIILSTEVVR